MDTEFLRETDELVKQYGLEEDPEYVIVPFTDKEGRQKKRYILRRRFVRVTYAEGYFVDYPLSDVIRATIRYPELPLSEALFLMSNEVNPVDIGSK